MRVYLVRGDLTFGWLRPADEGAWKWRGGEAVTCAWPELAFDFVADDTGMEFVEVDCLAMNTGADGLILSEFARSRLAPLLSPAGEFWPVRVRGLQYWWFNCLACVEALDRGRTDAEWSRVSGDWGSFEWITTSRRLALRPAKVRAAPAMFRLPEFPQGALFGGDLLAQEVERHHLTGFRLDLVWSAANGGVSDPPGVGFGGVFERLPVAEIERKRAWARSLLGRRRDEGGSA